MASQPLFQIPHSVPVDRARTFASLREKQDYLKKRLRVGVNFKGQHVENSLMEAVFSRGGRECALLLRKHGDWDAV
jgi:hypothetical protein